MVGAFLLLGLLDLAQAGPVVPSKPDCVLDAAHVIDPEVEADIKARCKALAADPGIDMVVMTIRRLGDFGAPHMAAYAKELHRGWALKDGFVVLISVEDALSRIQFDPVDGRANELMASKIAQFRITPRMTEGDYGGAVVESLIALDVHVHGGIPKGLAPPTLLERLADTAPVAAGSLMWMFMAAVGVGAIVVFILLKLVKEVQVIGGEVKEDVAAVTGRGADNGEK
jgi:uncharacterized membrane protein YgcG